MTRIELDMSVRSVDKALKQIAQYKKDLADKCERFIEELAIVGQRVASGAFAKGATEDADDAYVFIQKTQDGWVINAIGKDVVFIEFGAGALTDIMHPMADALGVKVYPGSWSEEDKQLFTQKGYWYYNGKLLDHITPRRGMLEAETAIRQEAENIARRIFG